MNRDLDGLRRAIAEQDAHIIAHLGRRLELVAEVADVKGRDSIAVMQPGQVLAVLARVERLAEEAGVQASLVKDVYERIIAEACRIEDSRLAESLPRRGRAVVLGAGVAGQIARRLLVRCGWDCTLVDLDPATAPDLVVDVADLERLDPLVRPADIVVFATPLTVTLPTLRSMGSVVGDGVLLVDFMSSKSAVSEALHAGGGEHQALGLNPLFGGGLRPVRPSVLAVPYRDGPQARALSRALQEAGVDLIECPDAQTHDDVCARWQALTHATVLAFGRASASMGEDFNRSGDAAPPPHRLLRAVLARMLSAADPAIYEEVQFGAPSATIAREALATAAAELAAGGVDVWRSAWNDLREEIPTDVLVDGELAFLNAARAVAEGL